MLMQHGSDSDECEFYEIHSAEPQPQKQSFTDYFKNTITNLAYNLRHSNYLHIPLLQRQRIMLSDKGDPAYYLGREYSLATVDEFNQHYRSTIWLSYRKGIKDIRDDRGWGCMIRAVQMLLAEAIRRICCFDSKAILTYFQQTQASELSLVNICRAGNIDRRWTSASQILSICTDLLKKIPRLGFAIQNETSGCLIPKNLKVNDKPTLLILHNRLGIECLEQRYLPHLKALMQLRYFSGMLGGTPGQAMFIMGYHSERVIFLDPHYVQHSQSNQQTYFKKHPRGIDFSKLSPCISISFIVKNEDEFNDLLLSLLILEDQHPQFRAIQILLSQQQRIAIRKNFQARRKISLDDFEVLE